MNLVEPKIFHVGETVANMDGVNAYLNAIGAPDWQSPAPTAAEGLTELFGRGCYRSFEPGMNANVTRVRDGNKEYLANIIKQGHGSVFEHVTANFIFLHVSRVFTHELVRHRVGVGVSQESLRFVRLDEIDFYMPPDIAANPEAKAIFEKAVAAGEKWQRDLAAIFKLDDPGVPFEQKKRITSAMRRIAPEGLATMIGWTGNFRIMRHVIEARTSPGAEQEIRLVFGKLAAYAVQRWPHAFGDYTVETVDDLPWYRTAYPKI